MIVEFSARQYKWYTLFDLLRIIESTAGFAKRLSGSDRCGSKCTNLFKYQVD